MLKTVRESEKNRDARVFQEQLDLPPLNVERFLEHRVKEDSQKKRMAPHVYPRVYCKATFIAPLILIGLSILLCDIIEIMMNRSLILVIDVAWSSCRRIGREKARRAFEPKRYRSITSSG